jgi:parallel beta-helix repeat protein
MDSVISSYKKSIFIENSQESVTIRSNTIIGNMYNAIYLKDTEDILITGNHLHGFSGVTNSPIHIENSDHIIINSNELYGNSGNEYGVTIDANGDYIGITENIFRDFVLGSVNVVSGANPHGRIYNQYSDLFMDIIVASTTAVHAAITGNGAEQEVITAITNPDVARNISITTTNVTSPSGDVTITGVDVKGNSTTEDITISAGGTSYGSKAFATVSKITIPVGVTTDDTVAIGISDKLGLSNIIYASGDVYKVKKNNADATVGTVNTTYGTVDCANITGGDDFTIYYKSNMNIIS